MRDERSAAAPGGNDRLDAGLGDLLANGVGVVAFSAEERLDPVGGHSEQRGEALHVMCLARCQHKAERTPFAVAAGVELGSEAATRSAKRLGLLIPLFSPTAQ